MENDSNKSFRFLSTFAKGIKNFSVNYKMKLPEKGSVDIIDKSLRKWILRFDIPHEWFNSYHINVNPKVARLKSDPHIPISSNQMQVVKDTAKVLKQLNEVLLYVAVFSDVVREGKSIKEDIENGTCRKSLETAASIAGEWTGGYAGAKAGYVVGSLINPLFGAMLMCALGGVAGAVGGAVVAEKQASNLLTRYKDEKQGSDTKTKYNETEKKKESWFKLFKQYQQ